MWVGIIVFSIELHDAYISDNGSVMNLPEIFLSLPDDGEMREYPDHPQTEMPVWQVRQCSAFPVMDAGVP
jgi:hypothetical protein